MARRIMRRTRRKRSYRKRARSGFKRRYRKRSPPMVRVKRRVFISNWQPNTVSVDGFWRYYRFQIDALPSLTEFTNLFDTYKIGALKVEFRPRFDSFAGNDTTDTTLPGVTNQSGTYLSVIKDPYSTTLPVGTYTSANYNAFCENGNVRTYNGTRPVTVYYKPTIDNLVGFGVVNQFSRRRSTFIQANSVTVPHHGFHIFAHDQNFNGTFGNSFDVYVTFYMTWKRIR